MSTRVVRTTVRRKLEELEFMVEGPGDDGGGRSPPWSRDELILALELYLRRRARLPAPDSPEVAELSALLNRMAAGLAKPDAARYRNANGVAMKLANFRRFDPEYIADRRVGLQRGGKAKVWRSFAADPSWLERTAAAIRAAVAAEPTAMGGEEAEADDGLAAVGGAVALRGLRVRPRGALRRARTGVIECHHTRPVHELRPGRRRGWRSWRWCAPTATG